MFRAGADWIYGIVVVMLFGTVVMQATPEGSYQKYVRLFLGVLLILTVFSPVFSWSGLSEHARLFFERDIMSTWLGGSDMERGEWQDAVQKKRESWLREPLEALVQEYGFVCLKYTVQWNAEGGWPQRLTLWVAKANAERVEGTEEMTSISAVDTIQAVGQDEKYVTEETAVESGNDYEPSELRLLHRALQTVWQLQEDQITLYWDR